MEPIKMLLVCLLILAGCNTEPQVGQWYESLQTGKRHKLKHILDYSYELKQFNERFNKQLKSKKPKDASTVYLLKLHQELLEIRAKSNMKAYYLSDYYKVSGDLFLGSAITEKELKEDYRLIDR